MPNREDIVTQMRSALALSDPDLDTTIGTTTRKILDAVAEVVAEAYNDQQLSQYTYDIDSKNGADLDDFVSLFGFSRREARRAAGTVIFERVDPAAFPITIPVGTQVQTSDRVVFQTVVPAIIPVGAVHVEVPIRAVVGGNAANVSSGAINQWVTSIPGISSFSNPTSTSGGSASESDDELRDRFKKTVFRNMAGTEDMFLGLALEDPDADQANVIGAFKRYREQIQLSTFSGAVFGVSSVQDAKYVYTDNAIFGRDLQGGDFFNQDVHYDFASSAPPVVRSLDQTLVPPGIYQLEFDYVPRASRNEPALGITNAIDIYVSGTRERNVTETTVWNNTMVFSTDSASPFYIGNYARHDGSQPVVGNYLIDFTFSPVIDIPASITVSGTTYYEGTHYWMINDVGVQGGTPRSYSGIEWKSAANGGTEPSITPNPPVFTTTYTFNEVPTSIESQVDLWKLVTTDLKVHQAKSMRLTINLVVVISPGFSQAQVMHDLTETLSTRLDKIGFNGLIQVSDIIAAGAGVSGIDAIRLVNEGDDPVNFGIQQYADDGVTLLKNWNDGSSPARAIDIPLTDDEVPTLNDIRLTVRAANTFGAV